MTDFSRAGVVPPSITAGRMCIVVALCVMGMQLSLWLATGTWLRISLSYALEPVFSVMQLGSWLIYPERYISAHRFVLYVMGLPLGLTLLLIGLFIVRFAARK